MCVCTNKYTYILYVHASIIMSSITDMRTLKNSFQAVAIVQTFRKQHTMNDCFEKHLNIYSY